MSRPRFTNKTVIFLAASAVALLVAYLFWSLVPEVHQLLERRMSDNPAASADTIIGVIKLALLAVVGYLLVRALNFVFFGLAFRLKRIDAPTLIRNIFTIVAFTIFFLIAFTFLFPKVNLGDLRRDPRTRPSGHTRQFLRGNFFAGRPAVPGWRRDHGWRATAHRRGRGN